MAKYIKKPIVIDAVQYQKGMEHGFCKQIRKGKTKPSAPYLITSKGYSQFSEDAYIVTDENGERFPVEKIEFERLYEKVER